ncbi:MAG: hypothetical protein K2K56_09140 [Lachnospiraceae bacterium]|nr:hypothetical protein [Lachnospiraceae bacterium]
MENSELELNVLSLEEQEKTATSLEDIYGYKVLTEEFQVQIDHYNQQKKQEQQKNLEYVFTREPRDMVTTAYYTVMNAQISTVIGVEYEENEVKSDSILVILGFTVLGAFVSGLIWAIIEHRKKGKRKSEDYDNR